MAGLRARRRTDVANEALIRSLFNEHGKAMLAYATRLTGDRGTAEDIVQQALVRAWRHSDKLVNWKNSVRGWLLTVVRNLVTDWVRARRARPTEVTTESPTVVPIQRDHAGPLVDSLVVADALERLSEQHRAVLEQMYLHGRTVTETAEVLQLPPGTVKSRSYYALRQLRELFQDQRFGSQGAA